MPARVVPHWANLPISCPSSSSSRGGVPVMAERWLPAWAPTRRPPEREVVRLAAQRSLRALGVAPARDLDRPFHARRLPGPPGRAGRPGAVGPGRAGPPGRRRDRVARSLVRPCRRPVPAGAPGGGRLAAADDPALPLRQPDHRPRADPAPVRLPLPHGDLRPHGGPPLA